MRLFARPSDSALCKAFLSIRSNQRLDSLVRLVLENQGTEPQRASLNYGPDQQPEKALSALAECKPEEVEAMLMFDMNGNLCLALSRSLRSSYRHPVFECTSVRPGNTSFQLELNLFSRLEKLFDIHYGYARHLSTKYSPLSEGPIKRSPFGSKSVSVQPPSATWLSKHDDVAAGAVKGLFPINFWSSRTIEELARFVRLPSEFQKQGLHVLTDSMQKTVAHENPNYKHYLHFGSK